MILSLNEIKQYLRIELDYIEEDELLNELILVSEEYIKNATGFTFATEIPEIAKHIVRLLVSHWYENRAIETNQMTNKIDFTVKTLLSQLSYSHVEDVV